MRRSTFATIFVLFVLSATGSAWAITCSHQCSGTPISCTATTTCNSGSDWIQCDSNPRKYCSPCTVSCPNEPSFQCSSWQRVCDQGWDWGFWISCDGHRYDCPACPNNEIFC